MFSSCFSDSGIISTGTNNDVSDRLRLLKTGEYSKNSVDEQRSTRDKE
jgi:hypothetical protein